MPSAISMTRKHLLRSCGLRFGCVRRHAVLLSRRSTCALRSTPLTACAASSSAFALVTVHRYYHWPYPDNFVPDGATTSAFQSSPVPSVRERIVREYALSPLFGRRTPCCVLGFADAASTLVESKSELRRWIAQAFGKAEAEVELGPLCQTKEMMLHRSGTYESPRLADGAWSRPDAEQRRLARYARLPVQARTLVEVYLPGEEAQGGNADYSSSNGGAEQEANTAGEDADLSDGAAEAEAAILAHGWFLQEQLYKYMSFRNEAKKHDQQQHEAQGAKDEVEVSIAALHDELGVIYCEVPPLDESGFLFDQLHGKEIDADVAERVVNRWTRRAAQQQQQQQQREEQEQKKPSA
ncbi:putative mitochondrial hypothetical protein [Leptomonas pyrrhocoris]|uniref:Uncharacterized protein n=1 Tax=Leptomonas pyrrhocoris TaxID=157538 RepID=A0A0M9FZK9_LEPPY|nr:putative mitochondrial hypothetical protein [Leptomonas pyrrhocoris]KPA79116.1 putative mitochondrial hypothetical protein [Leptomonas pyrrhocoris]|eukprot:XP_015657555.1 putative mitochondrial hypothetical protein [Leptomonas pyrrhocoris]